MQETLVRFLGQGRSLGGGHGNPLQYSYLDNPHEQRSLVGYSPWGCKESDTTERLDTQHTKPIKLLQKTQENIFVTLSVAKIS